MTQPVIGFCGMTHLGLNTAVATAEKGFNCVCFDPDNELILNINDSKLPVVEPSLDTLFEKNRSSLSFHSDLSALSGCDIIYIAPDVPTDDTGASDTTGITELLENVKPVLNENKVLVILSQVSPGFTRKMTAEFPGTIYYQVETLIFGKAVERALYPERFIVGCTDPYASLHTSYLTYLESFDCPILPMRYESAELAKISINMCLVASVSVANTMAEICENIGADWSEIVPALRLDRRIGQYSYLVPGLGISGGNLERDIASVIRMSETHNTEAGVIRAWLKNSQHRKNWPFAVLHKELLSKKASASITVLGLAYKENTHSTKNSPAFALLEHLEQQSVTVFDPVVKPEQVPFKVNFASCISEAIQGADAVVIMTPWAEFREISMQSLNTAMAGNIIIDPYVLLDRDALAVSGINYFTLGVMPERSVA